MYVGKDRTDFRRATRADDSNRITRFKVYLHLAPRHVGWAVKNINSFFYRDRFNAKSLLKKVRAKACRHASKNLAKFRLFTGAQHTNGFRLAAIHSSANNYFFWLGLSFTPALVAA